MRRQVLVVSWQAPDDFPKYLLRAATPAEYLLWQVIRNRQRCQAKFRRQQKLVPTALDFYCPEAKLAIECDELPHFTPNRARYAAGPVWNQRVYKKTARTGLTSSSPDPFSSRGGEGELDQQSLRDVA